MRMRHIVIYGFSGSSIFFQIILTKGTIFKKKMFLNIKCVSIVPTNFTWNISRSKKNWVRYEQKCILFFINVPIILSDLNETWIFSTDFKKILKYQI